MTQGLCPWPGDIIALRDDRLETIAGDKWMVVLCLAAVPALVGQAAKVWRRPNSEGA